MYGSNFANFAKDTRTVHELCHRNDLHILNSHLKDVMQTINMPIESVPFRLRLGTPDPYVHVKAQSRLFRCQEDSDFIMMLMTLISESEVAALETHMSNTNLSLPSSSHHHNTMNSNNNNNSMGGPLMTSVINGNLTQPSSNRSNQSVASFSSPPPSDSAHLLYQPDSFEFDFTNPGFEMDSVGVTWDSRPDSRASVTPVSTPRPPSVSAYSPATGQVCPSPLTPYHNTTNNQSQPSPQNNSNNSNNNNNSNSNNNNNNSLNSNANYNTNFSFSNFDDNKNDSKLQEQIQNQQQQQQQQPQQNQDSERLRILLTTKRPAVSNVNETEQGQKNRILKGLLNSDEDKESVHNKLGLGGGQLLNRRGLNTNRPRQNDTKNHMLLQLLNEKCDDEDSDMKTRQSELMKQLQKVR